MFVVPRIVVVVAALIWVRSPLIADQVVDAAATDAEIRIRSMCLIPGHWLHLV